MLMATNGPLLWVLERWISRATTSLPVPLSPVMRTIEEVSLMRLMISLIRLMAGLSPTKTGPPS